MRSKVFAKVVKIKIIWRVGTNLQNIKAFIDYKKKYQCLGSKSLFSKVST